MPKLRHVPEIYCSNCNKIIDTLNFDDCCKYCRQPHMETYRDLINRKDEPSDKKAWTHYFVAKYFESELKKYRQSCYFDEMVENYWKSALLNNREAKQELARLFEENDDELSLTTAMFLTHAIDGDWPKEYLKKIRETDSQKILEIALDFENNCTFESHRELAYKFYQKVISSSAPQSIYVKCRAMLNLVQMLLFDEHHYDDMYNQKSFAEPQLAAEVAYWLKFAMEYGEEETKNHAAKLYTKAKEYFSSNPFLSNFF